MPNSAMRRAAVSFSEVNTSNQETDLDLYREDLRRRLAVLIERMDSHSIALARLASGLELRDPADSETQSRQQRLANQ